MDAPLHLAALAGPDVGRVWPLPEGRTVRAGRAPGCEIDLHDGAASRVHASLRRVAGGVLIRDAGSAGGTRTRRWRRRLGAARSGRPLAGGEPVPPWPDGGRRVPRRGRTLRPGDVVAIGTGLFQVRRHPGHGEPVPARSGEVARALVPMLGAVVILPVLALGGGGPWRALMVIGLLGAVGASAGLAWWQQRRRRHERDEPPWTAPDPAGLLAGAGAPVPRAPRRWEIGSAGGHAGRRGARLGRTIAAPEPGGGVALIGRAADTEPLARWLLAQAVRADPGLRVLAPWPVPAPVPGERPPRELRVGADVAPGPDGLAIALLPPGTQPPGWAGAVVAVPAGHDRALTSGWWAQLLAARPAAGAAGLPAEVRLTDTDPPEDPAAVLAAWRAADGGAGAPLGVGPDGMVTLDLAVDGPHALVAGTTGAGKSELLAAWLLGLALRHPPAALSLLLIDYKGGATFGPLAPLPHVVGVLTDLDGGATLRALGGLRAELRRRERLFAAHGASDLAGLRARAPAATPARLVVVVDEFRALAQDHPEHLDELVRLAAQGRSLGLHLVLATQRPGGAVTPDMRANLTARVCLRVLEAGDSQDVLGDAAAAHLPRTPGRCLVRTDATVAVQAAWAGPDAAALVDRCRAAADLAAARPDLLTVHRPWLPDLPARLAPAELPPAEGVLPLGVLDLPEEQERRAWCLDDPGAAPVLGILGPARSGRTTAARAAALAALEAGLPTHVLGPPALRAGLDEAMQPALGTLAGADRPVVAAALLRHLATAPGGPALLVVDDADALAAAVDALAGPGAGVDLIQAVLRRAAPDGLRVLVTGPPPGGRLQHGLTGRLVLAGTEPGEALLAGVPRGLLPAGPPGRGVLVRPGLAAVTQVVHPGEPGPGRAPGAPPPRLREVPEAVRLPAPGPDEANAPVLGLGGDDAGPVRIRCGPRDVLAVIGHAGSGRSAATAAVAARLAAAGRVVCCDPRAAPDPTAVLVVDDLEHLPPSGLDGCEAHAVAGVTVIAAIRTEPLLTGYHPFLVRLRDGPQRLVLGPAPTALVGPAHALALGRPRPGRGVLHAAGRAIPVQVPGPPAGSR